MKTILLIIPLSLSLSVFGQIKMTGSRGGGIKNAPTTSTSSFRHKPPIYTNLSSSKPVTSRPTSNSSTHSVTSGSTNMNGSYTNMNNSFPISSRQPNNRYRSPYIYYNPNENGTNQLLEGYDNIAAPTQGSFVKARRTNLVRTVVDQIDRYTEEYGQGAIIYRHGFCDGLKLRGAQKLDAGPVDLSILIEHNESRL